MTAVVAATVIASLVFPSLSLPTTGLDPTIMAHIAIGEAGGWGIWGTAERAWELQAMVVWVARNQAACAWAPEDYDPRFQFYGWEEDITEEDVERAKRVLEAEVNPAQGMLHMISEQDRVRLGFPRGDIVECGVTPFCIHLYRAWPSAMSVEHNDRYVLQE